MPANSTRTAILRARPRCALGPAAAMAVLVALLSPAWGQDRCPPYPTIPQGVQRGDKASKGGPMRYWPDRPDQAEVVSATFLGGKGHEFLVDGGFQKDGTVVLAGNAIGGLLELGVAEHVLGSDTPRPPAAEVQPLGDKRQDPKVRASWRHELATGFIVRCRPDLKGVLSVTRLPWLAGAITSAEVGPDDAIYIAGRAGDQIAALGGQQAELQVNPDAERKSGECDRTFLARLSPDAKKVEWLRLSKGLSEAPRLGQTKDGLISFLAQNVRTFTSAGDQKTAATIPGGVRENSSVSPLDGTIVKGGEHHWATGRQPWRCPTLWTYKPDGTPQYQLYDWGGPYVVLDGLFLVSDTAVRMVSHDREGNVMLVLWSDGGNSVAFCQPGDIRTGTGSPGCGCSGAGANATSFAYLVRLEPKDYRVLGFTLWCSQYAGKGNGASVDAIGQVDDGSFAFAGGSAWGLYQTSNKLANGEPGGTYVAVLTGDLRGVRYSSCVPGAAVAEVGPDRTAWGIASGTVDGKPKVLFVGGAAKEANVYDLVTATPVKDALQAEFGGGTCDGYAIMLDLSKTPPADATVHRMPVPPTGIHLERYARRKGGKPGAPPGFLAGQENCLQGLVPRRTLSADGVAWPGRMTDRS